MREFEARYLECILHHKDHQGHSNILHPGQHLHAHSMLKCSLTLHPQDQKLLFEGDFTSLPVVKDLKNLSTALPQSKITVSCGS